MLARMRITKRSLSYAFLFMSLASWILALATSRFEFGANAGAIASLDGYYYIGVALLLISFGLFVNSEAQSDFPGLFILAMFVAELYFSPMLVRGFNPTQDVAYEYGISSVITSQGGLQSVTSVLPNPLAWVLFGALNQVLELNTFQTALPIYYFLLGPIDVVLFYSFVKQISENNRSLASIATVLFVWSGWSVPYFLNDVGLSFTLFLSLLLITSMHDSRKVTILMFVVTVVLVGTNVYGAFSCLGLLFMMSIFRSRFRFQLRTRYVFFFMASLFSLWNLVLAPLYLTSYAMNITQYFSSIFTLFTQFSSVTSASHYRVLSSRSYELITILFGAIAVAGFTKRIRRGLVPAPDGKILVSFLGILFGIVLIPVYGSVGGILGAAINTLARTWFFALFFVGFFGSTLFVAKRKMGLLLLVVFLVMTPLILLATYGALGYNAEPPSVAQGGLFVQSNLPHGNILESTNLTFNDNLFFTDGSQYRFLTLGATYSFANHRLVGFGHLGYPVVVSLNQVDAGATYVLTGNSTTYSDIMLEFTTSVNLNLVYDSGTNSILVYFP